MKSESLLDTSQRNERNDWGINRRNQPSKRICLVCGMSPPIVVCVSTHPNFDIRRHTKWGKSLTSNRWNTGSPRTTFQTLSIGAMAHLSFCTSLPCWCSNSWRGRFPGSFHVKRGKFLPRLDVHLIHNVCARPLPFATSDIAKSDVNAEDEERQSLLPPSPQPKPAETPSEWRDVLTWPIISLATSTAATCLTTRWSTPCQPPPIHATHREKLTSHYIRYTIFAFTPIPLGGLGLSELEIGAHLAIRAFLPIPFLGIFPPRREIRWSD